MSEIFFNIDAKFTSLLDSFSKGENVQDLVFIESRDQNKKPVRFTFELESLGDIVVSDYGHSVLCKLVSPDDVSKFESIEDNAALLLPETIEFKQFVRDEKFFMKLPHKNDKYRANIDPPAIPSQPEKSPFHQGAQIEAELSISMWVNFGSATAGLFLNVNKITVNGGKKRVIKRR